MGLKKPIYRIGSCLRVRPMFTAYSKFCAGRMSLKTGLTVRVTGTKGCNADYDVWVLYLIVLYLDQKWPILLVND